MIKTYRGILSDGGQDKIRLKTNDGKTGYRITKFQLMPYTPGIGGPESVVKIYKRLQSTIDGVIDFTDGDLLAAAYQKTHEDTSQPSSTMITVFDQEIFNQDIYITGIDMRGIVSCNYYLELEQVMLNDNQTTMATLQSLRQIAEK